MLQQSVIQEISSERQHLGRVSSFSILTCARNGFAQSHGDQRKKLEREHECEDAYPNDLSPWQINYIGSSVIILFILPEFDGHHGRRCCRLVLTVDVCDGEAQALGDLFI